MSRKRKDEEAARMPTELSEIKAIVDEFMSRYDNVENEIDLLKEDPKNLVEEFRDRLDMKTLKQAIRTIKIKKKVSHKNTYDAFVDILEQRETI